MSVARFIADQRTNYRVPVAVCCAILGLSVGWFYTLGRLLAMLLVWQRSLLVVAGEVHGRCHDL